MLERTTSDSDEHIPEKCAEEGSLLVASKDLVIPTLYVDEPVMVASTGFRGSDNEDLEFIPASIELICNLYGKGVYNGKTNVSSPSSSTGCSRTKGCFKANGREGKLDVSCISTETTGDDDVEGNFKATILVLPEELQTKIRTFRVLFALARGIPIVTERWVYDSMARGTISEWYAFRVQRYKHLPLFEPSTILARCRVFLGNVSKKISLSRIKELCELVGGKVVEDISQCSLALFGTEKDYFMWQKDRTLFYRDQVAKGQITEAQQEKLQESERAYAMKLANLGQLCTLSLIGDSLEKGELINPDERTDEQTIRLKSVTKTSLLKSTSSKPSPQKASKGALLPCQAEASLLRQTYRPIEGESSTCLQLK